MSFLTFILLISGLLWLATIHLLNSSTHAGELARLFVRGLIERITGTRERLPSDGDDESEGK
jgi:hypothetical protein